jgi:hypothetical protein
MPVGETMLVVEENAAAAGKVRARIIHGMDCFDEDACDEMGRTT